MQQFLTDMGRFTDRFLGGEEPPVIPAVEPAPAPEPEPEMEEEMEMEMDEMEEEESEEE